jgi:hypothetical protein
MAIRDNTPPDRTRLYRHIHEDQDRHGNVRVYFWRGKGQPKIRLRERPGTVAFDAEYQRAYQTSPQTNKRVGGIVALPVLGRIE